MRTIAAFVLALVSVLSVMAPTAARAQQSPDEQQQALLNLVNEQRRRIEALEARFAELQREVKTLRGEQAGEVRAAGAAESPAPDELPPFEHAAAGSPPEDADPEAPGGDLPTAKPIDAYGSLRVAIAWDTEGHHEIRNNGTRVGLRGEKELIAGLTAFGRVEVGVNMVANDLAIIETGDPGAPIGQGSQAIASRLGFVGVETPLGNVSWGKQWAAYYDVAEFTDQFQIFSAFASGAYAARTDGGIAGTGRAERAFLYREERGPLSVALQAQSRALTTNDRSFADTWGASTILELGYGFSIGAAYNQVRDGVPTPNLNEPQLGDEAALFGVRFENDKWYAAGTYSILTQHEIDDMGRRFDGNGFELAIRRQLTDRLWVEAGYNDLRPDSDHPGDYRVRLGIGNVVYRFGDASRVFIGLKIDDSRRSDGTSPDEHAVAAGLNYTF